nr:hypothetical protein [Tanacetum cinerariifolium]
MPLVYVYAVFAGCFLNNIYRDAKVNPLRSIRVRLLEASYYLGILLMPLIGRFYLFANLVRFERPKKPNLSPYNNAVSASSYPRGVDQAKGQFQTGSYVNVVNGSFHVGVHGPSISSTSVLVLDDSCVTERDLSNHVMGKVKDLSSISNLRTLIMEEGFSVVNLVYFGGLWEMEYTSDDDFDGGPHKVPDRSYFCEEGPNDDR